MPVPALMDLEVAGYGPTDVADAIFVRDGALADVGNDFLIRVGVTAEAGAGRNLVVVPDHEGAEWTVRRIAVGRNDEVVTRLQPAVIAMIERFLGSKLQHNRSSTADAMDSRFANGYGIETIERLVGGLRTGRSIW